MARYSLSIDFPKNGDSQKKLFLTTPLATDEYALSLEIIGVGEDDNEFYESRNLSKNEAMHLRDFLNNHYPKE